MAHRFLLIAAVMGPLIGYGCFAREPGELRRQTDDDAGTPGPVFAEAGPIDARFEIPPTDPHAVLGVDPPHGPFSGGARVVVRGNGFKSNVRVWFGATEVAASDVTPVDPGRVQVIVPPSRAGAADVTLQNGDDVSTRRSLIGGYVYDQFYLDPPSGPTVGGTIAVVHGFETKWDQSTKVSIDLEPCRIESVRSPTELTCATPPRPPGSKPVRVTTSDGVSVDVLDAFTYGDSDNGFRGGLSGQPLVSELRVLALDNFAGIPIAGASVIAGDDLASAIVAKTDQSGGAVIQAAGLGPKRTVTIAKKCYQPITFVDVPVDTVTAYLDPVISPACASEGDPPPVGGTPGLSASIKGELLWESVTEFQRAGWTNVPRPKSPDEKQVAYVFRLAFDATERFQLPPASAAITPDSKGGRGFEFSLSSSPGNLTLYALAGIENRKLNPPVFTAYAAGLVRGVGTKPGSTTSNVFIEIDVPLDQALSIRAGGPDPTPRGPDRLFSSVAVRVADQGYAILPISQATRLLPVTEGIDFVGLPALVGSLGGAQYVATARAATGVIEGTPRSVAGLLATTTTSQTLVLEEFVQVPALSTPALNGTWNGVDLATSSAAGGASVALTVYEIESGGGLSTWTLAVPGGNRTVKVPDLRSLGSDLGPIKGPLSISVTAAHIAVFDYGSLRYRQLDRRGWDAYATDVFLVHY